MHRGWSHVLHEQPSEQAVSKEDSWRFGNQGRWLYQRLYVPSSPMCFSLSLLSAAAFLEFHEVCHFFAIFWAPSISSSALLFYYSTSTALLTMFSHSLLSSTPKRHRTVQTHFSHPTRCTTILSVRISLWTASEFAGVDRWSNPRLDPGFVG